MPSSPSHRQRSALVVSAVIAAAALAAAAFGFAPRAASASPSSGVVNISTKLGLQNAAAAGTGIVLTSSGEVLTNNHVIRGATSIRVTDPSTKHSYSATVLGYSVASDVAVLQLKGASNLHTVRVGDSGSLKVGDRVTALGNANGAGGKPKPAAGRITGLGQTIVASDDGGISEQLKGLIRTNAPLQPGDSGGPLVDSKGRVVGMDTAASLGFRLQSASQAFAIPINRAVALARQIAAHTSSATVHIGSTPFLGISVANAPGQSVSGVYVGDVVSGSPADRAGLMQGDVVTAVDGKSIASYNQLSAALLKHAAGQVVSLTWVDQFGSMQSSPVTTTAGPPQ